MMGSNLASSARSLLASSHSLLIVLGGGGPAKRGTTSAKSGVRGGRPLRRGAEDTRRRERPKDASGAYPGCERRGRCHRRRQ